MKMLKTLHLYLAALGVCLLPGGCGSKDMLETKVYFLDDKELSLAPERRIIEMQYAKTGEEQFVSQVESVLNTLIKGPTSSTLRRAIPKGTKLLSVSFKDHIVYADFSKAFKSGQPDDPRRQALTIDSVYLSLAQWPGAAAVKFLVEGESLHPFAGYANIDEPVSNPILPR